MSASDRYRTASAFRAALERRLRTEALRTGIPLNRLRKDVAFNRLLARLGRSAKASFALKGGLALIARIGPAVRATKDADLNWRAGQVELENTLETIEVVDVGDWFGFGFGEGRVIQGEGELRALRFPVEATLDQRRFEAFHLDVNLVDPSDPRPVEIVTLASNPFDFIDEPPLRVPMISPTQQLAEKLHAYSRIYRDGPSNRAKDLFDMLVIVDQVGLPKGSDFTAEVRRTFAIRETSWPPPLASPPEDWQRAWRNFRADFAIRWADLDAAAQALTDFWRPVLNGRVAQSDLVWSPDRWTWA